jgi:hypothetical protein
MQFPLFFFFLDGNAFSISFFYFLSNTQERKKEMTKNKRERERERRGQLQRQMTKNTVNREQPTGHYPRINLQVAFQGQIDNAISRRFSMFVAGV